MINKYRPHVLLLPEDDANSRLANGFLLGLDDGEEGRLNYAKNRIPEHLRDRVFIVGALTDPEALKRAGLGSSETIGRAMAKDCREETDTTWGHDLLRHNTNEINRLRRHVRPFLFQHI